MDTFYTSAAIIYADRMNYEYGQAYTRVLEAKTGRRIDFLQYAIVNGLTTGTVHNREPVIAMLQSSSEGHFGYDRKVYPEKLVVEHGIFQPEITSPVFIIDPEFSIADSEALFPAFREMLNAYRTIICFNHDYAENMDHADATNGIDFSNDASFTSELQNVEPAEQVTSTMHNETMREMFQKFPQLKVTAIASVVTALKHLQTIAQATKNVSGLFIEKWLERIFGPIFYFTPLNFHEKMPEFESCSLADLVEHNLSTFGISFTVDNEFIASTSFGRHFTPGNVQRFASGLEAIAGSAKAEDRFRKHQAKELLHLITTYYHKSSPENQAKGMDAIYFIFLRNRLGKKYDGSHFWSSKCCPQVFLPGVDNNLSDYGDMIRQAIEVRKLVGITDPTQSGYADPFQVAHAAAETTFQRSLRSLCLDARLRQLEAAVEITDLPAHGVAAITQAILGIRVKMQQQSQNILR